MAILRYKMCGGSLEVTRTQQSLNVNTADLFRHFRNLTMQRKLLCLTEQTTIAHTVNLTKYP